MNNLKRISAVVARVLLGATFIFSGFVKAVDPLGTTYKIEDYLKAFGGFFTSLLPLAEAAAICLITFEFVLGVCLLLNVRTKVTSWLALLMMVVMTPLTLYLALTNPITDCGCFGDAIVLSNWATFWKNVVLLALVIVLLFTRNAIAQTFSGKVEAAITALAVAAVAVFMWYNLSHLPVIDFRPYKVGNNIPQLMEYPDDAPVDEYQTTLIYAKDGVEQEFTIDNYPKNDPDWTFVDSRSVLIKKGYEPPIHDFEIVTYTDAEDITDQVLDDENVTLAVLYEIEKTDQRQLGKLLKLALGCYVDDRSFFLLTGSGMNVIEDFMQQRVAPVLENRFGMRYALSATDDNAVNDSQIEGFFVNFYDYIERAICTTDPVTLKTIVRANPGIVRLSEGTITEKYNLRNIDDDKLNEPLEKLPQTIQAIYDSADYDDGAADTENYTDDDVYTDEQEF